MVDSSAFELSEFYFAIEQLLRIAADWIQESMDDLQSVYVRILERCFSAERRNTVSGTKITFIPLYPAAQEAALAVFHQNWKRVLSHQQRLGNNLLSRIAKKREEVKSLRDGLFNATSVSEATKSSQLNHYILAFTVVTIFYLPLSFIAILFAFGMFEWDDLGQTVSFVVTTVLVAGGTYIFSGLLIWIVRKPERRQGVKQIYINSNQSLRDLLEELRQKSTRSDGKAEFTQPDV
ncbi:hypothetical protein N656DRAFT_227040 [Canariomyces notabilis]|uniref:Uncharacterized protein n=1 Tax=Canariomyces notabilis TaxID=2074819 RepID=A0AAN6YW05_9PEZI|nr:hypothetical protein N656DRAFT_227040 [Canariomyces arenarius]